MEEKERYEFGQRTLFNNREELTTFDGFNLDDFMQIICKLLNQQDKRIKGLEETNKELEIKLDKCGIELVNAENLVSYLENENQQLKQQLAITEKALELACERVKYFEEMQDKEMGFYEFFGYDSDYDLKAIIEQYKEQAKEMLENE